MPRNKLIWQSLLERLAEWDPNWRERAGLEEAGPPLRSAGCGPPISNREAFEAFAVALLSGNTRWERIAAVRGQLAEPFLGFDLCKPDRHVLRALASWDLVTFARWNHKGPFTAPDARPRELLAAMLAVRALAAGNGLPVTYANSVIWLAGAVSGARLTNAELKAVSCGPA